MVSKTEIKLLVVIFMFLVVCIFVYGYPMHTPIRKMRPLSDYLKHINGYETLNQIKMTEDNLNMLDLDDYIFINFKRNGVNVNLYIGYYYTSNKAYAAHSPLVCYPSQGWKVERKPITAMLDLGDYRINYEEIVTSFGQAKELVLYWYQAGLHTNTIVYRNKISMGYNKFTKNDEQHGFVRISIPFTGASYADVKKTAIDFMKAFYPRFIEFINSHNQRLLEGG